MIALWLDCHSTVLRFLHNRRPIRTETLTEACRVATNELRTLRLTTRQGLYWDAWTLVARSGPGGLPRIVASGDHAGATWIMREPLNGIIKDRTGEDYGWPGLTTRSRRRSGRSQVDSPPEQA